MVLLSLALLPVMMVAHVARQSRRTDRIIAKAVGIQITMERQGAGRAQINDAICLATLGDGFALGRDWELKEMVKSYILPSLGLLASSRSLKYDSLAFRQYWRDCAEIDHKIDGIYEYRRSRGAIK